MSVVEKPVSGWVRSYLEYRTELSPPVSWPVLKVHVASRIARPFELIFARIAMGYQRYESNRGRSPCYREWLQTALDRYDATGNLDPLLDVAFYAMAEFENPSKEGTYYEPNKDERDEL